MFYKGLFIGLTTIDIQYFVDDFPKSNKKIKTHSPDILVGGPASNAALAFAHLNNGAHLATAVGDQPFTSFIFDDFKLNKIDFTDIVESQKVDPIVASVVTSGNGDRNIFTHNPPAIQAGLTPVQLFEKLNPEILLLDGFYPEFSLGCARLAREKGVPVVIDCGSWKTQYVELLQYTDIAICSADFFPPGTNTSDDVFEYFNTKGVGAVAISRGSESILFQQNGRGEIRVKACDALDTLGAGDFLHGAFCYYFLKTRDFKSALKKASEIASFTCGFKGTREWLKF